MLSRLIKRVRAALKKAASKTAKCTSRSTPSVPTATESNSPCEPSLDDAPQESLPSISETSSTGSAVVENTAATTDAQAAPLRAHQESNEFHHREPEPSDVVPYRSPDSIATYLFPFKGETRTRYLLSRLVKRIWAALKKVATKYTSRSTPPIPTTTEPVSPCEGNLNDTPHECSPSLTKTSSTGNVVIDSTAACTASQAAPSPEHRACDVSHLVKLEPSDAVAHGSPGGVTTYLSPCPRDTPTSLSPASFSAATCSDTSTNDYDHERARANWCRLKVAVRVARASRLPPQDVAAINAPKTAKILTPSDCNTSQVDVHMQGSMLSSLLAFRAENSRYLGPITVHTPQIRLDSNTEGVDGQVNSSAFPSPNYDEKPRVIADTVHDLYFVIDGTLGSGAFGTVMKARLVLDYKPSIVPLDVQLASLPTTRTVKCAIKVMQKDQVYQYDSGRFGVRQEEKALRRVTHSGWKFLTAVWAMWDDHKNIYFAMPLYHGELTRYTMSPLLRDPKRLQVLIAELIIAVSNLHGLGVMHRDIKPSNVLVSSDGHIALADFGMAYVHPTVTPLYATPTIECQGAREDVVLRDSCGGTDTYLAPEIIQSVINPGQEYTCKIDVWAIGLVIYEMALGLDRPWFGEPEEMRAQRMGNMFALITEEEAVEEYMKVKEGIWKRVTDAEFDWAKVEQVDEKLANLLKKMLDPNPSRRISTVQALQHVYFDDINFDELDDSAPGPLSSPPEPSCKFDTSLTFRSFYNWERDKNGDVIAPKNVKRQKEQDRRHPNAHLYLCQGLEEYLAATHAGVLSDDTTVGVGHWQTKQAKFEYVNEMRHKDLDEEEQDGSESDCEGEQPEDDAMELLKFFQSLQSKYGVGMPLSEF